MAASTPDPMPEASLPKDGKKATMDVVDDDEEEEEVSADCCVLGGPPLDTAGDFHSRAIRMTGIPSALLSP